MSRPLRIEFEGAWYHVMNRGAGRRIVFPSNLHRRLFLDLLGEIRDIFGVQCHAYCLMGNHYHLLLCTPRANLGRAMRHLDGVYTQRHNRHAETDGPLFRGRYKAILVDEDRYLLQVCRYIHRNPLDAGVVKDPMDYPWSSHQSYLDSGPVPAWLECRTILALFGSVNSRYRYERFVGYPNDEALTEFYGNKKMDTVLGSDEFKTRCTEWLKSIPDDYEIPAAKVFSRTPAIQDIVSVVADHFGFSTKQLQEPTDSPSRSARALAMALCRNPGGYRLREIATALNVRSYSTVGMTVRRLKEKLDQEPDLASTIAELRRRIFTDV